MTSQKPQEPPQKPIQQQYPAQLQKALLEAQLLINPVVKDAENTYSKYRYVKGETIYIVATRALLKVGLVARRRSWNTADHAFHETRDDEGVLIAETRMVSMEFELCHPESGEFQRDTADFPAQLKKGTPLDKAVAAALTTSLAYWLRDLLLIPRVDHEMDKRNDEDFEPGGVSAAEAMAELKQMLFKQVGCQGPEDADAVVRYAATDSHNGSPVYSGLKQVEQKSVAGIVHASVNEKLENMTAEKLLTSAKEAANVK